MSKPYAEVIGDPIAQSKSPLIHNFWLEKLGLAHTYTYKRTHIRPEELEEFLHTRRNRRRWKNDDPLVIDTAQWCGCNITVPHKETALALVDGPLPNYVNIGAINVVVPRDGGLSWANSDMDGVAGVINDYHDQMINFGVDPNRKFSVGIIGAGGAAKAASAVASMLSWIGEIRIAVRRPGAGRAMLDQLNIVGKEIAIADGDIEGLDILINASTMGMGGIGDASLTLERLGTDGVKALVFDMVYHPLETGLLRAAKQRDHNCANGLQMLIIQASAAFELFFGQSAPRQHDAELRALLTA